MQSPAIINGASGRRILRASIPVAALSVVAFGWLIGAAAQEVSNGKLAAVIRASGYPCAHVIKKERSSEGSSVWRVHCNSGHFQVTLKGDSAPEVVPID
jgi:hypothetical protein